MELQGATVVVTGATGGLGRAICRRLAGDGARLVAVGRDRDALAQLADRHGARTLVADLRRPADVEAVAAAAVDADATVLAAGVGGERGLDTATTAQVDELVDVNLRSAMVISLAVARARAEDGLTGRLVLLGSMSGRITTPDTRVYNATKFGLRGFSLALRQDVAPTGLRVTLIEPGFVREAGMFADSGVDLPRAARTVSPDDVADGVVRAVRSGPALISVAPVEHRAAAVVAAAAPRVAERLQRAVVDPDRTTKR